jgi:hypothetical protein
LNSKSEVVNKYLDEFPRTPSLTLAKKIYKENNLLFKNVDSVRTVIRYKRGAHGKKNLKELASDKYLIPEKRIEKYNLPVAIESNYEPYSITGNKGLIFADAHIPFHNISAFNTMFDYTAKYDFDFILIDGDLSDMFEVSSFNHEPDLISMPEERDATKKFLKELKRIYPKAKIYLKFGNHERRFEQYLMVKAKELFDFPEFRWDVLLGLYDLQIEYIPEDRYIDLSGLNIVHAHEYKNGITSPANPARTLYLRTKDCTLGAHYHQSSEHTEPSINGKIVTCWSIGCMCDLHPKYMPLNKWNNGFAIYSREDDNFWHIKNKRIVENRVV